MSFDLVSYLIQQAEQQQLLCCPDDMPEKEQHITHLVALALAKLIAAVQHQADDVHQKIVEQQSAWLTEQLSRHISSETQAQQFFQPLQQHLDGCIEKFSQFIVAELAQLERNTQFGAAGLRELLDGQYTWMQSLVQPWFWDSIGQPQYKIEPIATEDNQPAADYDQIMQEISQMVQQADQKAVEYIEPKAACICFRVLNPLIALAIIIWQFCQIL